MSKWCSPAPKKCDICQQPMKEVFYDCLVPLYGRWGCLCVSCFMSYECSTGTGRGQKYSIATLEKLEG